MGAEAGSQRRHARLLETFLGGTDHVSGSTYAWSSSEPAGADTQAAFSIDHPRVFIRLLRRPGSLGAARSFISGDVRIDGETLALARGVWTIAGKRLPREFYRDVLLEALRAAIIPTNWIGTGRLPIEYRPRSPLASIASDRRRVGHHYALPVEFYSMLLGSSMTYSSAIFAPGRTLLEAQQAKHERILQQLALGPDGSVLDIGSGWGGFADYCRTRGRSVVGFTPVSAQVRFARDRDLQISEADFRSFPSARRYAGVVSIGVFEHVGPRRAASFFERVRSWMEPGARYVNQTIVRKDSARNHLARNSFTSRFVWPGGELIREHEVVKLMKASQLEAVDVFRFGQSYAETLKCWLTNLEQSWDYGAGLVGEQRCRAWQLYLAGTSVMFETEMLDVIQVTATGTAP